MQCKLFIYNYHVVCFACQFDFSASEDSLFMFSPDTFHLCPQAIETCVAAAGFSVGEFAALVFSGAMNFAEGRYGMFPLLGTGAGM